MATGEMDKVDIADICREYIRDYLKICRTIPDHYEIPKTLFTLSRYFIQRFIRQF
jgi:hypothetical protein